MRRRVIVCGNSGSDRLPARAARCEKVELIPAVTGRAGRRRLGLQGNRPALPVTAGWSPAVGLSDEPKRTVH